METTGGFFGYSREGGVLHGELNWLVHGLEWFATVVDLAAIAILVLGAVRFILGVVMAEIHKDDSARVRGVNRHRVSLGRYILAGLELLIVSDIIQTALSLAMIDLVFLALLVVIRSLISYFLERELGELKRELAG